MYIKNSLEIIDARTFRFILMQKISLKQKMTLMCRNLCRKKILERRICISGVGIVSSTKTFQVLVLFRQLP